MMVKHRLSLALSFLITCCVTATPLFAATDEQIADAIKRMQNFFYTVQDPQTGKWAQDHEKNTFIGGETALVAYALLTSGESPQNPAIKKALDHLAGVEMTGTYAISVRAHVWAHLPDRYLRNLEKDAKWLFNASDSRSRYRYKSHNRAVTNEHEAVDHSTMQYGILGMWENAKRTGETNVSFYELASQHIMGVQNDDGGWGYQPGDPSTGSMTTAGITILYIVQQQIYRDSTKPNPAIDASIKRGLRWLNKHFNGVRNHPAGHETYYYLYGIERVGLASGVRYFGEGAKKQDWFQVGADHILQDLRGDGSINGKYVNTAFALMFLSRGRYPVWINKLQIPGHNWNNHPNDIHYLTQFMSDERENELNWQIVDIRLPPEQWLNAPILFLSGDDKLHLGPVEKQAIKRYLDLGGILFCNPDDGNSKFIDGIRELARELYPQWPLKDMNAKHPLFEMHHKINVSGQRIQSVSNGVRDLIIIPSRDWGFLYQSDKRPGEGLHWRVMTNLYVLATDRGINQLRLTDKYLTKPERVAGTQFVVGRARYEGNWLPEPGMWEVMSNYLTANAALRVETTAAPFLDLKDESTGKESEDDPDPVLAGGTATPAAADPNDDPNNDDVPAAPVAAAPAAPARPAALTSVLDLDKIGETELPLVHLCGVDAIKLSDAQKDAIKKYIDRGGTLLIETVGGRGDFTAKLQQDLVSVFSTPPVVLRDHPIVTGKGLTNGRDNSKVRYRRYTVVQLRVQQDPRLSAIYVGDRPAILLSSEDLSLGALGIRHWGILGYDTDSARSLIANTVLFVKQTSKMATGDQEPVTAASSTADSL